MKIEEELKKYKEKLETQAWGLQKTNESIKLLYKELEASHKKLQEIDLIKTDFISHVSHELRTPVTTIVLGLDNILAGVCGPISDKQVATLQRNLRNARRLEKMINDLLDLSRLESGRTQIEPRGTNLSQLIHKVIESFQPGEKEGGVEVGVVIEEDFAPGLPDIDIDPDLIAQVVTNLLSNAIRYVRTRIHVKTSLENATANSPAWLQVSVTNDGPGIPPDKLGAVFDKFVQLDREQRKTSYRGTGLGLAICKEIMERHQGKIWAESPGESGVAFHFTLPICVEDKK